MEQAPIIEQSFQDSRFELEDCESEVSEVVEMINKNPSLDGVNFSSAEKESDIRHLIDQLNNLVANFEYSNRSHSNKFVPKNSNPPNLSKSYLVSLNSRLLKVQFKARASEKRLLVLLQKSKDLEVNLFNLFLYIYLHNSKYSSIGNSLKRLRIFQP